MRRLSTARLSELQQLRVLAHPLRLQLLELFAAAPRTTKQAAEILGESPTRLYHHVHALERARLVELTARRQVRGTVEKYYRATARRFELDRAVLGERGGTAMATSMFDLRGELAAALAERRRTGGREPLAARTTLLLDDAEARALRAELIARVERMHAAQATSSSSRRRKPWNLTVALLPAAPAQKPRRRRARPRA